MIAIGDNMVIMARSARYTDAEFRALFLWAAGDCDGAPPPGLEEAAEFVRADQSALLRRIAEREEVRRYRAKMHMREVRAAAAGAYRNSPGGPPQLGGEGAESEREGGGGKPPEPPLAPLANITGGGERANGANAAKCAKARNSRVSRVSRVRGVAAPIPSIPSHTSEASMGGSNVKTKSTVRSVSVGGAGGGPPSDPPPVVGDEEIMDPALDACGLAAAVTGDAARGARGFWRKWCREHGEAQFRGELFTFRRELLAGEEPDNRAAAFTARLKRLGERLSARKGANDDR